jgi:hypothetical protein
MKMKTSVEAPSMKPEALSKFFIRDDDGADIAYTRNGIVYGIPNGQQIATLRSGKLYTGDGQFLGVMTPSGKVRGVDGKPTAALVRLLK